MKTKLLIVASFVPLLMTLSCAKKAADPTAIKAEVKAVVGNLYTSFEMKDMDLMSQVMAHDEDMVNFGTDLSDHEVGWKEWKAAHLAQFKAIDKAPIHSKALKIFLSKTNKVAWFSDVTDWDLVIQNSPVALKNVRITGVLEKREAGWKIVQIHASLPQE